MWNVLKKSCKGIAALALTLMVALAATMLVSDSQTPVVDAAAKVKLNTNNITMTVGKTYTIKVKGTKEKVKFYTKNKKIASVSKNGIVKANKAGKTRVDVKVGKKTYKVNVKVEAVSISKSRITVKKGSTYKLQLRGTSRKVKWESNNTRVATVDKKGRVTAKGRGQAIITARINDAKFKCKVMVGHNVIQCPDKVTVAYGQTVKVTLTAGDSFRYSLEDGGLASVRINPTMFHSGDKLTMTVEGKAVGTTYIVFKSQEGWTKKCKLIVTGTPVTTGVLGKEMNGLRMDVFRAYRSANKSDPQLYVENKVTNVTNNTIRQARIYYTFFDKQGKEMDTGYQLVENLGKGKSETIRFIIRNYFVDTNKVGAVKVAWVEVL